MHALTGDGDSGSDSENGAGNGTCGDRRSGCGTVVALAAPTAMLLGLALSPRKTEKPRFGVQRSMATVRAGVPVFQADCRVSNVNSACIFTLNPKPQRRIIAGSYTRWQVSQLNKLFVDVLIPGNEF